MRGGRGSVILWEVYGKDVRSLNLHLAVLSLEFNLVTLDGNHPSNDLCAVPQHDLLGQGGSQNNEQASEKQNYLAHRVVPFFSAYGRGCLASFRAASNFFS